MKDWMRDWMRDWMNVWMNEWGTEGKRDSARGKRKGQQEGGAEGGMERGRDRQTASSIMIDQVEGIVAQWAGQWWRLWGLRFRGQGKKKVAGSWQGKGR
jgi:hypothetical protein